MNNKILLTGVFVLLLLSCNQKNTTSESKDSLPLIEEKQLNISILLDLSDRIDTVKYSSNPQHYKRDIANILYITEIFQKEMEKYGAFKSKGKMNIFFYPKNDPQVDTWIEKLHIDLSKMDNKQKKTIFDNITQTYSTNLNNIYQFAINQNKWTGSEIWRFFKNDVIDYCIEKDNSYRNILILFSDGYIYDAATTTPNIKNRYPHLLSKYIAQYRNMPDWKAAIDKQDFGLIAARNDLQNLEIIVLEISPEKYQVDEDILNYLLSKWFKEMNVKRFAIYNSDIPEYTKKRIDSFINP